MTIKEAAVHGALVNLSISVVALGLLPLTEWEPPCPRSSWTRRACRPQFCQQHPGINDCAGSSTSLHPRGSSPSLSRTCEAQVLNSRVHARLFKIKTQSKGKPSVQVPEKKLPPIVLPVNHREVHILSRFTGSCLDTQRSEV